MVPHGEGLQQPHPAAGSSQPRQPSSSTGQGPQLHPPQPLQRATGAGAGAGDDVGARAGAQAWPQGQEGSPEDAEHKCRLNSFVFQSLQEPKAKACTTIEMEDGKQERN